jgi:hypothetical protein
MIVKCDDPQRALVIAREVLTNNVSRYLGEGRPEHATSSMKAKGGYQSLLPR